MLPEQTATVDWGDGTTGNIQNSASTSQIVYAEKTDYAQVSEDTIFCVSVSGGQFALGNNSTAFFKSSSNVSISDTPVLIKAELGANCISLRSYAFFGCDSLTSVVIPQGITAINQYSFENCYALKSIIIPPSVSSIGN